MCEIKFIEEDKNPEGLCKEESFLLLSKFSLDNLCENIKLEENIFDDFFDKTEKLNLSKEKILKIANYDYLKAITILIILKNEQWMEKALFSRWTAKNFVKFINEDWIRSKWKWQIRITGFGNDELSIFFNQKENITDLLSEKNNKIYLELKKDFKTNKSLTKEQKIQLLENEELSTILVSNILDIRKKRTSILLKKIYNINWKKEKFSEKDIFFYSTLLVNSYHISPAKAIKWELFTNNILKIAEKLNLYKENIEIEKRHWIIVKKWIQKKIRKNNNNLYKRNLSLKKVVLGLIINNLDENKYSISELKTSLLKINNSTDIPKEILELVKKLNKELNIKVENFSPLDYKNTDEKKQFLYEIIDLEVGENLKNKNILIFSQNICNIIFYMILFFYINI